MPGVTTATGRLAWKVARRTDCDATSPQPLFSGFLKGRFEIIGVFLVHTTCLMNHAVFEGGTEKANWCLAICKKSLEASQQRS